MTKINVDVNTKEITSAYVVATFNRGKEVLEKEGYRIISLEENAKLRMQEGIKAGISQNGNWVREGVLYVPDKDGVFLTKNSPIMINAKDATRCDEEFYLTPEQVERGLDGAVRINESPIPTTRFGESEIMLFAFGKDAQKYGDFLKEEKIDEMFFCLASASDKAFARQVWSWRVDYGAQLDGGKYLDSRVRVRGIKNDLIQKIAD